MPYEQAKGIDSSMAGWLESANKGSNHLLVIAIDAYDYCPVLNNCVKDAQDFAQLLWDRYQFEERLTTFLFNKDATRSNILEKLSELEEKVQEQDSLLIYYSGHGETKENAGYWIPVNGRGEHRYRHEWVSTDDLIRHLDAIDSFHTVVIADACFSGSLFAPLQKNTSPGNERYKSRLGLAASHSRGKALDGTAGENSPFAERLLQNLKENKSELGFWRLATMVQEEVSKVTEGRQTPVFKPLNVKGDDSGQFVFKLRKEVLNVPMHYRDTQNTDVFPSENGIRYLTSPRANCKENKTNLLANLKAEVQECIAQDDLSGSFKLMEERIAKNRPIRNTLLLIKGRFSRLRNASLSGAMYEDVKSANYASIACSLLELSGMLSEPDIE